MLLAKTHSQGTVPGAKIKLIDAMAAGAQRFCLNKTGWYPRVLRRMCFLFKACPHLHGRADSERIGKRREPLLAGGNHFLPLLGLREPLLGLAKPSLTPRPLFYQVQ